ncbi:maleylpyruvate isomerase N-terminal domain-containing protein [Mycolicibacterium sp. NCC-Tsukiji]|uniref:maleylpyruvate isomerase N-terminal domain-containing protein n=1 Tax=Mycolicibacterium sp. NCC-Tsukiji TaxID=2185272 RepID=UPI000ECB128E|nr:maleylpyruvate isomerase N-terminal domain-containing protein [Mycolicibacterium sp. NCC-Tsukiji]GCA97816.1 hypothetical protein NCCNTM_14510 [Mycolicibacterium sp. NCC-Tsukiji]
MSAEHRRRRTPPAPAAAGCRKRKATASTVWAAVHTERRALVEDLTDLTERQWETPSLCQDWAVRDVVAHLAATATLTRGDCQGTGGRQAQHATHRRPTDQPGPST